MDIGIGKHVDCGHRGWQRHADIGVGKRYGVDIGVGKRVTAVWGLGSVFATRLKEAQDVARRGACRAGTSGMATPAGPHVTLRDRGGDRQRGRAPQRAICALPKVSGAG